MKFKVWDKTDKKFLEKNQFIDNDGKLWYFDEKYGFVVLHESRFTVVHSTGQTDKNGVEIYGGDIMPPRLVVTWLDDNNDGLGMNVGWYLQRDDFESWTELEVKLQENTDYEIIGNKYQNPELLTPKN